MLYLAIALLVVGFLTACIGGIWGIVVAFQRSVLWGLAVLLLPLANFVFLFVAWAEAKRPFWLSFGGVGVMLGAALIVPRDGSFGLPGFPVATAAHARPEFEPPDAPPGLVVAGDLRSRLNALKEREAALLARKAKLAPNDQPGALALAQEIARYNAELQPLLEEMRRAQPAMAQTSTPAR